MCNAGPGKSASAPLCNEVSGSIAPGAMKHRSWRSATAPAIWTKSMFKDTLFGVHKVLLVYALALCPVVDASGRKRHVIKQKMRIYKQLLYCYYRSVISRECLQQLSVTFGPSVYTKTANRKSPPGFCLPQERTLRFEANGGPSRRTTLRYGEGPVSRTRV